MPKRKPNHQPFGNKRSGKSLIERALTPRPSKKVNSKKNHHDSLKGGQGNSSGRPRG